MGAAPPPAPGGPDSGDSDTPPTNGAARHRQPATLTTDLAVVRRMAGRARRSRTDSPDRLARRESGRAALLPISYPDLPVAERRDEIAAAIRDHQVVIVAGETGSGKTTQLPKICLELGRGVAGLIGHTQPRRLAARTVADRIAEELGVELGGAVGYSVRFTDQAGADTLVQLMTDGILLAEIQRDRDLRRYDTIIIDEAHERSLNIDFLLGYLKQLLPRRPDLKLVVTSATIDTARFAEHFGDAPVVEVTGRTYPVEVRYRPVVDPDAADARRGPRPDQRGARRGRRADAPRVPATSWCSSPASGRSATPPRRCAAPGRQARAGRRAPALRAAVRRRAAQGLRRTRRPPGGAGHQRRRDLADRAGHPLRRRPRHGPHLALQPPAQGAAAADRGRQPGQRQPAGRPVRAHLGRHLHPALHRGRLRRPGRSSPSRRSCAPTWPRSSSR